MKKDGIGIGGRRCQITADALEQGAHVAAWQEPLLDHDQSMGAGHLGHLALFHQFREIGSAPAVFEPLTFHESPKVFRSGEAYVIAGLFEGEAQSDHGTDVA